MASADLKDTTVARLQKHAIPLQDTYDSVINRLLDAYEAAQSVQPKKPGEPLKIEGNTMHFDPNNAPPLGFTTLTQVVLNGEQFAKADTYWNKVMNRVIIEAAKAGNDADALFKMLTINAAIGEKTDNGYTYLPEAGLSVQGQDSNAAFRQAFQLAEALRINLKVYFYWQDNEKAAYPNQRGLFEI